MEFITDLPTTLMLLFVVALFAGCLDTLAGGGGLIVLPALLLTGIPPLQALGTNKMQGTMGTAMASLMMLKHKRVRWNEVKHLMLSAFIGATIGSVVVQYLDTAKLNFVIPLVLIVIAIYFLFSGQLLNSISPARISSSTYRFVVVPLIGSYDGLFGPGTGSFFALSGVALQGKDLLSATAIAKTLNFATNIASLVIFIMAGKVIWIVGFAMMIGQAAGAWLGAHILFRINLMYLRLLIVGICIAMLIRYFW
ncbi:MAG: TSUP family transporter [Pseudomonadota bacterium]